MFPRLSHAGDEALGFNEEEQDLPEFYLAESASLDVSHLWQRRFSPVAQDELNWVVGHWAW